MELADRLSDVIVAVLGGGRGTRLGPLTAQRAKPAVPIAGKFRLIDIPLSNAFNSGMNRVFVLTQFNSLSLHRHIVRTYTFDPFSRGFVQILAAQQTPFAERWYQGTADAVRHNLRIMEEMRGQWVLILSGDHLYRMDFRLMLREHVDSGADVSIAVLPCSEEQIAGFGAVRVDPTGRVSEFREKPGTAEQRRGMEVDAGLLRSKALTSERPYLASMGIYLFDKQVLAKALANDFDDFGRHVLPAVVGERKVQAHFFGGYWRDIGTIRSFFEAHMDMVRPDPPFDFNDSQWQFYTRPRYLPGATVDGVQFDQSIISGGSTVTGSVIRESIIGIRTRIHQARLSRTLVMGADHRTPEPPAGSPPLGIGPGSVIEDAIIDKNVRIGRDVKALSAGRPAEASGPGWVISDGIAVITKAAIIPDGTVIG